MSFDLWSWLWWRLLSLVVVVVVWLLLAFGVSARRAPVAAQNAAAIAPEFEAARQSVAIRPCEGRPETAACRFESQSGPQSALAIAVPRLQGRW